MKRLVALLNKLVRLFLRPPHARRVDGTHGRDHPVDGVLHVLAQGLVLSVRRHVSHSAPTCTGAGIDLLSLSLFLDPFANGHLVLDVLDVMVSSVLHQLAKLGSHSNVDAAQLLCHFAGHLTVFLDGIVICHAAVVAVDGMVELLQFQPALGL